MNRSLLPGLALLVAAGLAQAQPPGSRAASPAADPVPETRVAQTYPVALVEAGSSLFASQCGFCHGRDTRGGAGGADLARSLLVAEDVRGDRLGPAIRDGRPDAGMPAFAGLSAGDVDALVAFIHEQKARAATEEGGRQSVAVEDLLSGDATRGRRYFEQNCVDCHAADGDLAGIAGRMQGLRLLQRMLYPQPGGPGGGSARAQTRVEVTTADGRRFAGVLVYRDEFAVALRDSDGRYRSFGTGDVELVIDNPLDWHIEQLGRYSDRDMHDLITYLHTLQ